MPRKRTRERLNSTHYPASPPCIDCRPISPTPTLLSFQRPSGWFPSFQNTIFRTQYVLFCMKLFDTDPQPRVVARESDNSYSDNEPLDTPSFLQSLEMEPTDLGALLLDYIAPESTLGMLDFGLSPTFDSFPEYPDAIDAKSSSDNSGAIENKRTDAENIPGIVPGGNATPGMNSALTKVGALLPLPQLSNPVINNLQIKSSPVLSGYLQNGGGGVGYVPQLIASAKKKKPPAASKLPPAFIQKMWLMINDPANRAYIRWSNDGELFLVTHREEFMKSILPKYFKHNNFASFVRQLNMYGWHKVQDVTSGLLREDRSPDEVLQFKNPLFLRGREDLLDSIMRNRSGVTDAELDTKLLNLQLVLKELELVKMNQLAIIEDMRRMRKDNQILWNESFSARERHMKQTDTLEKIMKFLAAVYGNSAGKVFEVKARSPQPYDSQVSQYKRNDSGQGAVRAPYASQVFLKPQLMLTNRAHKSPGTQSAAVTTDALASQTPSEDGLSRRDLRELPSSMPRAPHASLSLVGNEVIEQIMRTWSDLAAGDADKVFHQIMNPDASAASTPQSLADFAHYLSHGHLTLEDKNMPQEDIGGLEQNIYRQGRALLHVQDLVQQLAVCQTQQQEQLQQRKRQDDVVSSGSVDDFDVGEFLSNNSIDPIEVEPSRKKRHIEEMDEEGVNKRGNMEG